jgi:tartrate-resistant acid phosphatase type 5
MKRSTPFRILVMFGLACILICACQPETATPTNTPQATHTEQVILPISAEPTETLSPTLTATQAMNSAVVRFAVIGDYGSGDQNEGYVADLVHSWQPDFIITVGDNNYPLGAKETIDDHIGKFYYDYISPYTGKYGNGAEINRFFPTIGNHDVYDYGDDPYLDYFSLPGNERYYDFTWGPVHFFALNSEPSEPDGTDMYSKQAEWLKTSLAASSSEWNVVYDHYPPYSSGYHGSIAYMRWPFAEWGADVVISGHDHDYERLSVDGIPYIVDGLGGGAIYDFKTPLRESVARFNTTYGAMLVTATQDQINFGFFNRHGKKIDWFTENK